MANVCGDLLLIAELGFSSIKKVIVFSAIVVAAVATGVAPAHASEQAGTVTKVAFAGGRFLFWVGGARTGTRPACDCCGRWEMAISDASSQARMSVILTAYAQGKAIFVQGYSAPVYVAGSNDTESVYLF